MPRKQVRDQDGIYNRADSPYWWASLPRPGGGSTRRSTGIPIAEDPEGLKATAVRAKWRAEGHTLKTGEGATFDDLLLRYFAEKVPQMKDPGRCTSSAKALYPFFTGKALANIGGVEVRAYIAHRLDRGLAPGTVNKEISLMSGALNWAKQELDWELHNPWSSRFLREPKGRTRFLSHEEAAALLREAERPGNKSPYLSDLICLILATGLRMGEALGLEWSRVDLARHLIRFEVGDQKNGAAGTVPINAQARAALIRRANWRATWCPQSNWVFCTKEGARFVRIYAGFYAACRRAGIEDLHPHDLRRTCGSWLVQAGVGIERVSALLRHGDVGQTSRVYAHLRPRDLAEAVAVLDEYELSRPVSRTQETAGAGEKTMLTKQ